MTPEVRLVLWENMVVVFGVLLSGKKTLLDIRVRGCLS